MEVQSTVILNAAGLRPVVSERQTAPCVFTQTRRSPLLLQATVDSTNSRVRQKIYAAVNTPCVFTGFFFIYWLKEKTRNKKRASLYCTDVFQVLRRVESK